MNDYTVDVDATKFSGARTIYIVVSEGTNVYLDAWKATETQTDGIREMETSQPVERQCYDLSGRRLPDNTQHQGIVIEQYTDENGEKHIRKRM